MRATQSLTEQDVFDGDRLWIRFIADTEKRSQVIEHISTAVSQNLSKRFAAIDPVVAVQVGASMVAIGVVTVASVLLGLVALAPQLVADDASSARSSARSVLGVSMMLLMRAQTQSKIGASPTSCW